MSGADTPPAFTRHQYRFTAHIRNPEENPRPEGIEPRRMKVYTDLLYNNIENFIRSGFPVIRSIYNDADWHRMIRAFFSSHRCRTPYFLEIGREFIDYLENEREPQAGDPAGLVELAHYEWIELALHVADEDIRMDGIDANGDLIEQSPVFSPLAWPLAYRFPVHRMRPDYLPEEAPAQPSYLMIYRNRQDEVKFLEMNPVTARLVALLQADAETTGRQAIEKIIDEMQHGNPQAVMLGGRQALEEMQGYGIILGTRRR